MTSQLTGGFDICFEISQDFLTSQLNSAFNATPQGQPFVFKNVDIGGGVSVNGEATLRIDTASLTIDPAHSPPATSTSLSANPR